MVSQLHIQNKKIICRVCFECADQHTLAVGFQMESQPEGSMLSAGNEWVAFTLSSARIKSQMSIINL